MNRISGKACGSAALLCAVLLAFPIKASAYNVPETVRVGLEAVCKNASSASIGTGELLIGTERDGRFEEGGAVSGGFTARPASGDYIAVDDEMDCDDALDLADSLSNMGLDAYAAYLDGEDWTVYVRNASRAEVEQAARESATQIRGFTGYSLSDGRTALLLPEDAVLMGTERDDTISVNGKRYRGMLTFAVRNSALTAVNVVGLEEYLYGIVPAEMPQSYEEEALKAQAVAARTYAITKLGAHTGSGYQLCDTTACQVYQGYDGEAASAIRAVDDTAGEIACYNGVPIEAVFSASTGGYTENSENVWSNKVAYLRAVPEVVEEYGDNTWKRTLTLNELDALLSAKRESIGAAEDIEITKLSTGGRVQELKIIGSRGSKTLTKEEIRTYFSGAACGSLPGKMFTINGKGGEIGAYDGKVSAPSSKPEKGTLRAAAAEDGIIARTEGSLKSMDGKRLMVSSQKNGGTSSGTQKDGDYEVYSVSISTVSGGKFVFEGVGFGHGVGLSQKGAQAMALEGYDYEEILYHYYTDITIED